jgi:hypothetical protein
MKKMFVTEITFFGNRFKMATYNRMFKSALNMEGRYLFGENTIKTCI